MKRPTESSLAEKAILALADATANVIADHQRTGRPLAVWRDGKAVWIPSETADVLRETPATYRTGYLGD